MEDADWQRLLAQLGEGMCTPVVGAGAVHGVYPTASAIAKELAGLYNYPFNDDHVLPRVAQYAAVVVRDPLFLKQRFVEKVSQVDASVPVPHRMLATYPLPVYLTTNYDDLLVDALIEAGRQPQRVICPWYREAGEVAVPSADPYPPDPEHPMVFHLCGHISDPASLVLTEDDQIRLLKRLTEDFTWGENRILPAAVHEAIAARPKLILGHAAHEPFSVGWTLMTSSAQILRRRNVSVQMAPYFPEDAVRTRRAKEYVERLLESLRTSVYWGTVRDFFAEVSLRAGQ